MSDQQPDVDVVVVGAGIAGLYLLYRLREMGMSAVAFETGDDVGGTWYWNRYPGARCDVQSIDYSYSWDAELDETWEWSERYATQPEILRYVNHVADKHDLRRHITFETRVDGAAWNDDTELWTVATDDGQQTTCRYYVMATGCLSSMKDPDIAGTGTFEGDVYFTGRWPHEGVDFTGKRVGVIGTGSSAIQSIPIIASQASELTVFQRTPNFSLPAHNGPVRPADRAAIDADRAAYRQLAKYSSAGVPRELSEESALTVSEERRQERFEEAWEEGTIFSMTGAFMDLLVDRTANEYAAEFVRNKIRSIVDDPTTAEALCPTTYPLGTKRLCLDTNYYATFNEPHVTLVDLFANPISSITPAGIDVVDGDGATSYEFDALVYATGFDAMTGAIVRVDIAGRNGVQLKEKWAEGPKTYLGLMSHDFPNLFMVTGPQSPSVLSNMAVSIEQHVDWICDTLDHLRDHDQRVIEPTQEAEDGWVAHANDFADMTLFPEANSWYMGANVPGKARVVLPYLGGVDRYRRICDAVVDGDYVGFARSGPSGEHVDTGVICRLQPDVMVMLEMMAELDLPPMESMPAPDARAFSEAMGAASPPGPEVGDVIDATLPGADGNDLDYRLYRPATPGPHPITLYFHGGGWVIGNATSDDALCRDLCNNSGSIIISVDYRHGPEAKFPAAHHDAYAALAWVAEHADELGGNGELAVAGWSAGANLAAHVAQRTRDEGGPSLAGQVLLTPVTDCAEQRQSYTDNGEGYVLTKNLMDYFLDNYIDEADRTDPIASPLRASNLAGLAPAMIVTCEFDPLRDEGDAYAAALREAGVDVEHVQAHGQIHTSVPAVGAMVTSATYREQMAAALRGFFGASVAV
ncbi:flavin-containing monooxygenase [Ilumatobacter coccineus]|uniref:Putative flavin-containing monooxygenase n=1 Tax=Ilumatobacter coccineus (strain NBRC 103263 / KCTC 29153 / YM16-304) TaxID=1313172 RepID=A0A6C7EBJ2_ILUCY|nr:alpha/beta hydrolase fold domain-containing protein [Ilumatobacter coccineus]BAN02495.1 putative flavin-containing monooxygenase [Ilumatobacter coccineus YM16-304]